MLLTGQPQPEWRVQDICLSNGTIGVQLGERQSLHGSQERQAQALPETGVQPEAEGPTGGAPANEEFLDPQETEKQSEVTLERWGCHRLCSASPELCQPKSSIRLRPTYNLRLNCLSLTLYVIFTPVGT